MPTVVRPSLCLVTAAALVAAAACSGGEATSAAVGPRQGGPGAGGGGAVPITVARAEAKAVPLQIQAVGSAQAYSTVQVRAQITGELTSVNFKEGDDVRQGQVLFTLDKRPLAAALEQAKANLTRDLAQTENARAQAQRAQDLAARGIVTKEQLQTSQTNQASLEATAKADQAAVDNARVQLLYATIVAPLSGRTGALMVNVGNLVRANDTSPLITINQVTPIFVSFGIPEAQLGDFKRYMDAGSLKVEANAPNATMPPVAGTITFVDNQVDQTTGQIRIKGTFANEDRRLWPGQFLNVVVTLTTDPKAVVVPSVAVQTGQQGQYVFIVKPDQTVDLRPVTVARTVGTESVIGSGVEAGDTIVTDGQLNLVPGSKIAVKGGGSAKVTS